MEFITEKNLKEKLALLSKLGFKKDEIIVLIKDLKNLMKVKDTIKNSKLNLNIEIAYLAKELKEVKNAKKAGLVASYAKREFFENKSVDIIINPEFSQRNDFIHHRNSGLNQVLLNLCKPIKGSKKTPRKNKLIISSLKKLRESKNPEVILGRMKQNAIFAKKYEVQYEICSFADKAEELISKKDQKAFMKELLKKPKNEKIIMDDDKK